jgi:uroporphyrinogen-III synthase
VSRGSSIRETTAAGRIRGRIVALGTGAKRELRERGLRVDLAPARHVAPDVAEALGDVAGADVLLVRREGASPELPRLLRERGARVEDLAGYAMRVRATDEERARLEAAELDAVAIANPTAAAFLARALAAWGLEAGDVLPGIVGAAGPVTARAIRDGGLAQEILTAGGIRDLVKRLGETLDARG